MFGDKGLTPQDFGASFKGFMDTMAAQTPAPEPVFVQMLEKHFETDPTILPVVTESFSAADHPNLQVALDDYTSANGRSAQLIGIAGEYPYVGVSLASLVTRGGSALFGTAEAKQGPVQYTNVTLDDERVLACVQSGLFLIRDQDRRLAVLLHRSMGFEAGPVQRIVVEAMAAERPIADRFLADLRTSLRQRNVYRGHVLSLTPDPMGQDLHIQFHKLPAIHRDEIILPGGLLEQIERQTMRFSQHSERLRSAKRHLKRGILLHGVPGTGKTLTVMYLASQMRDRTVLLLTGRGLGALERTCAMARLLQPSIVVLEDVDLVAEERLLSPAACFTPLLFELLNQMDGLAEDVDVLFVLTTNRPDILEPALAARPGRVDQAICIPLPDAGCRRRLFELYSRGLPHRVPDWDKYVGQTEGVSPAFIRELLRQAALFAADDGADLVMEERHLDEALHELVVQGGELTRILLGAQRPKSVTGFATSPQG